MKENSSLFWIDWRLAGRMTALQSSGRFAVLLLMAFVFLSLFLSAGAARCISSRYVITALLKESVSAEEALGLAKRIAALAPVLNAEYRDPAASWKEFTRAYPGVESISDIDGAQLPGYIEIRIRPDSFTAADVDVVTSVLKPLAQVDKVLAGEDSLPGIFKVARALKKLFVGGFVLLAGLFFAICRLQERILSAAMAGDFEFLMGRGVAEKKIVGFRAMGAAVSGGLLSGAAVGVAFAVLNFTVRKHPSLANIIGPREELFSAPTATAAGVFVLLAAVLFAGASVLGWTPLRSSGDQ